MMAQITGKAAIASVRADIRLVSLIFLAALLFGVSTAISQPVEAVQLVEHARQTFQFIQDASAGELFVFIFLNNAVKALFAILLGVIFGIVPLLFIVANAYLIGIIGTIEVYGEGLLYVVAGILPHGIVEIPAVIIAAAWGVWLGKQLWGVVRGREISLKTATARALRAYRTAVLPLVLIAALIEAFITPFVLEKLIPLL